MPFTYQRWPFLSRNMHAPDQEALWWQFCFVRTPSIDNFLNASGSAAVIGGAGSGKSICLDVLKRETENTALQIDYLPQNWPHGLSPWVPGKGHLSQIMAAAALTIRQHLEEHPKSFIQLNSLQKDFFYWIIDKYLKRRALLRLCHRLQQATGTEIDVPTEIEDLYPSDTQETDVWNQISELADLAHGLGYQQVLILIDLNEPEAIELMEDVISLFSWLTILEYPDWSIRAALPYICIKDGRLSAHTSGRLNITRLNYDQDTINQILAGYLRVATGNQYESLPTLASDAVLAQAQQEIKTIYEQPTLAGWINWTEALLNTISQLGYEVPIVNSEAATRTYYERHFPLRLTPNRQGVWRGPQFLPLDERPYELLKTLFQLRGKPDPTRLIEVAGSGENLNTLMSRLRKEIEPLKGSKIYLKNRRDQGYWLENYDPYPGS